MQKKHVVIILICIFLAISISYSISINIGDLQTDTHLAIAKEIYSVESGLQNLDENWDRQSITQITPYTYQDAEGNTIVYYYCNTVYSKAESDELTSLNTAVIGQVLDLSSAKNKRDCLVNSWNAIHFELNNKTYLCWTISQKESCIIEYTAETAKEEDIFRMAESIKRKDE